MSLMQRGALCGWSVLLGIATACGARTELDNTGYDDGSSLGATAGNPTTLTPSVTTPTTIPPSVPPGKVPEPPVGPPMVTPSDPPIIVIPPDDPLPPPPAPPPCDERDSPLFLRSIRPSICGDGIRGYSASGDREQCDDGNTTDGDGCDSSCRTEQYFDCPVPNSPCTRVDVCGDGLLGDTENCDDGNTVGGDGCSGSCQIEVNAVCPTPGQPCKAAATCGDGVLNGSEQCERSYPGCMDCTVQPGWVCPAGYPCFTRCGDGISAGSEQCDDGNLSNGDGCDSSCAIEWDYCLATGECGQWNVGRCGNAILEFGEGCDDGTETDFCTADCRHKPQCDANGCLEVCGDGIVEGDEECDDGNIRVDDGCSQCRVEPAHSCSVIAVDLPSQEPSPSAPDAGSTGSPPATQYISVCRPVCGNGLQQRGEECDEMDPELGKPNGICKQCKLVDSYCGNGIVEGDETCDDGMNRGEAYGECPPGCGLAEYCGDGIVQPRLGETCDLGKERNVGAYQTCTSRCQLAARCGDGVVEACGLEECDDGNRVNGDGCSMTCRLE